MKYGIEFVYISDKKYTDVYFETEQERNAIYAQIGDGTLRGFLNCGCVLVNLSNIAYCGLIEM